MTYKNCKKVIENMIRKLNTGEITIEEFETFKVDMSKKLDVFLLNDRIGEDQYNELIGLM